jgi:hypothetical protein
MRVTGYLLAGSGAGLLGWSLGRVPELRPNDELAVSPLYVFIDGSKAGKTGQATFVLTNRGSAARKVLRVERSCSACIAVVTDLKGAVLEPGQSRQLVAQVEVPGMRVEKAVLYVVHDGENSPLELLVEVSGRESLPYLVTNSLKQVAFLGLNTPTASEKLVLTTYEPVDRGPWLGQMTCDLPEVIMERTTIREHRMETIAQRVYEFRIGWRQLPSGPEFSGRLRVATNYGSRPEIEVGLVAGTLSKARAGLTDSD